MRLKAQILIARLLADRQGCYLHSAGAILNGAGVLFVGHSDAGKSTTTNMLIEAGARGEMNVEILCDDRNIVRKCFPPLATTCEGQKRIPSPSAAEGQAHISSSSVAAHILSPLGEWRVYGTWSHGDVPLVSGNDAPLRAICFIEQANENTITPLTDRKEITRRLIACVIKPFVTADWWEKTLDLIGELSNDAPCYVMRFDKSEEIVGEIKRFIGSGIQWLEHTS